MESHNLAWLAGFLEGEGYFTSNISAHGYCRILIGATSTDRDVLDHIWRIVPYSRLNGPYKPARGQLGKKETYRWILQVKPLVIDLAEELRPLMGGRRQGQIDTMLLNAASYPIGRIRRLGPVFIPDDDAACA
jgi:hypothetical protein